MRTASRRTLIAGAAASLLAAARSPFAEIEAKVGGRLGVAALDLSSGRRIGYRADERFPMCSTFKAMAAAAVLSRVDSPGRSNWIASSATARQSCSATRR